MTTGTDARKKTQVVSVLAVMLAIAVVLIILLCGYFLKDNTAPGNFVSSQASDASETADIYIPDSLSDGNTENESLVIIDDWE